MSYIVRVGDLLNDGEDYAMWFESPNSQPTNTVHSAERLRDAPLATAVNPSAVMDTLHVVVRPGEPSDDALDAPLRSALLRTLDTRRSAVPVTIADNDGGNERYRYYVTQAIDEQEDDMVGLHWVATLTTADDTMWRSTEKDTVVWDVYADGTQLAVTNGGDAPALPTYRLQPTADREAGWDKRVFVVVHPNAEAITTESTPYDITDGGWNTASLVTAGTLTSADQIGVIVDGMEVRRWIAGYNTTTTRIWVNLAFTQPDRTTRLHPDGITSGDEVLEVRVMDTRSASIAGWPSEGMFSIDNEVFTYTGKDAAGRRFTGVTRAARDTVAAEHSGYAYIRLIEHDIWIVYGGQTAEENFFDDAPDGVQLAYDDRKPLLSISDSRNDYWIIYNWPASDSPYRQPRITPYESLLGGTSYSGFLGGGLYNGVGVTRQAGVLLGGGRIAGIDESRSYWRISLPGFPIMSVTADVSSKRAPDAGEWLVYINTAPESSDAIIQIPQPPAPTVYSYTTYTNVPTPWFHPKAIYFGQEGTAEMEAILTRLRVDFDPDNGPLIFRTAEHDNYAMDTTLMNRTTEQSVTVQANIVRTTEVGVAVDTELHRVTLIGDGSNYYRYLTKDTHRSEILPLAAGLNTLQLDEVGLVGMRVVIEYRRRYYT